MDKDKFNSAAPFLFYAVIGIALVIVGLFFYRIVLAINGGLFIVGSLLFFFGDYFDKEDKVIKVGWLIPILIIALTIVAGVYNDKCYISSHGEKRHRYEDCSSIAHSDVHKVTKCNAWFLGKRSDCKICEERRVQEREQRLREIEAEERQEKIDERLERIAELQKEINTLRNGGDVPYLEDYWRDYLEDEIIEDYEDAYDERYDGIPSRYR